MYKNITNDFPTFFRYDNFERMTVVIIFLVTNELIITLKATVNYQHLIFVT